MSASARSACRDLAAAPGTEAEAVLRFVPGDEQDEVLALEALFRSMREVPVSVSDPAVGAAKLGWWQKELVEAAHQGSQHPVVTALLETNVLGRLDGDALNAYLHGLVVALQDEAVTDVAALRENLRSTVGQEAHLLAGGEGRAPDALVTAAAAARLLELARSLGRSGGNASWLPLDLVARHGFRAGEGPADEGRAPLVSDLAAEALAWRREAPVAPAHGTNAGTRFLALKDVLVGRRLEWARRRPEQWLARGQGLRVTDVFAAWRGARRLAAANPGAETS